MPNRRQTLKLGGALLMALLEIPAYAAAQTSPIIRTLYDFAGNDGSEPVAAVVIGNGEVLYGTTYGGGTSGYGTVFSLTPPTSAGGAWTETVLHNFTGGSDGAGPEAPVVIGGGGVLYGTTHGGGTSGYGTVFSLTPPTSPGDAWTEAVLYSFAGGSDGAYPFAGVVAGKSGALYGTTYGRSDGGPLQSGTVFELVPSASPGGAWAETVLYNFTGGSDGGNPMGSLVIGRGTTGPPVFYGTTSQGGSGADPGNGTVFSLTPPASPGGAWTETVLYEFLGMPSDGLWPQAGVVIGQGGVLYGTTLMGGTGSLLGNGTVFSLTPPASPGGSWTETVLYSFTDLGGPNAAVVIASSGVLYGTTIAGGTYGEGSVFSLTAPVSPGGAWTETLLHSFTGYKDGGELFGSVVIGKGGVLYGTTYIGGTSWRNGTAFALKP